MVDISKIIDEFACKNNSMLRSEESKTGYQMNKFDVAQYMLSKGILNAEDYNNWLKSNEGTTSRIESQRLHNMPVFQSRQVLAQSGGGYLSSVSDFSIGNVMGFEKSSETKQKLKSPNEQLKETKFKQRLNSLQKTDKSYKQLKYEIDSEKMSKGQKLDAQIELSMSKYREALDEGDFGKATGALLQNMSENLSKAFYTINDRTGINRLKKYLRGHTPVMLPNGTVVTIDMDKALDKLSKWANDGDDKNLSLKEALVAGAKGSVDFADDMIGAELAAFMGVFGAIAKCAEGAKYGKLIANTLTGIFTTMGVVDGVEGLSEMSNAKTQKEAESAFNKIYNSLFILSGTGHSFVKGKTKAQSNKVNDAAGDGSGYLYSTFWPFKGKKAETKPTETIKNTAETPMTASQSFKSKYDVQKFLMAETDTHTEIKHLEREDIGLSVSCGGYRSEVASLSKIEAPDVRGISDMQIAGYDKVMANTSKSVRCYDSEKNVTVVAFYRNDNGTFVDGVYIPGKISQADADAVLNIIRNKYCDFLGKVKPDKFERTDWKAVQQEIADFLNKGGVKATAPKQVEPAPMPFEIPSPKPTASPFQPTPAFTPEPAKPIATPKPEPVKPAQAQTTEPFVPTEPQNDLQFGGVFSPAKPVQKPVQSNKPFLNDAEVKILDQTNAYMPEKMQNAIKSAFEELGLRLKNGEKPSKDLLFTVANFVSQKCGVGSGIIMGTMEKNLFQFYKIENKWASVLYNQQSGLKDFLKTRE